MGDRLRQYEQGKQWQELEAYLRYVTKEIFGERNQPIGVQYVDSAKASIGTGTARTNGVLVTFSHYDVQYPCDPEKKRAGATVRFMLGVGDERHVSPDGKKVFWYDKISTCSTRRAYIPGHSYTIAGSVEELHYLASDNDPKRFKAAQEWDRQRREGASRSPQ